MINETQLIGAGKAAGRGRGLPSESREKSHARKISRQKNLPTQKQHHQQPTALGRCFSTPRTPARLTDSSFRPERSPDQGLPNPADSHHPRLWDSDPLTGAQEFIFLKDTLQASIMQLLWGAMNLVHSPPSTCDQTRSLERLGGSAA